MKKLGNYLSSANRKRLAKKLRAARRLDRGKAIQGKVWRKNRSLSGYSKYMRTNLPSKIQAIIRRKGSCKLLDVGCGDCVALAEARDLFGPKVRTHGLRLFGKREHPSFADLLIQSMADKIKVGSIENYAFREKYDMIVSFAGMHYTVNAPLAIEKIANALSVGGEAHLQVKKGRLPEKMIGLIRKQGFKARVSTSPGNPTILHIKRTGRRRADLGEFMLRESKKAISPKINIKEGLAE